MTDAADPENATERAAPLPQSRVLSYVATADTPTRVRTVAAISLRIAGWILVQVALGFMGLLVKWMVQDFVYLYDTSGSHSWSSEWTALLLYDLEQWWPLPTAAIYLGSCGITFIASAGPVGRARRVGCYLSSAALVTLIITLVMLGIGAGLRAFLEGAGGSHPLEFLWLGPALLCVVVAFLLRDLANFLVWIARNPITEKPAVPFLPLRTEPSKPMEN